MDGCARTVNDHFFSYGPPDLPIFDLYQILDENDIKFSLEPNGLVFEDPVFFPSLKDDFFLNIIMTITTALLYHVFISIINQQLA